MSTHVRAVWCLHDDIDDELDTDATATTYLDDHLAYRRVRLPTGCSRLLPEASAAGWRCPPGGRRERRRPQVRHVDACRQGDLGAHAARRPAAQLPTDHSNGWPSTPHAR